MRLAIAGIGTGVALLLAGCSPGFTGTSATGAKPMGAASTASGAASKEPGSPNSLPQGDVISGPLTTNVGRIGTTSY